MLDLRSRRKFDIHPVSFQMNSVWAALTNSSGLFYSPTHGHTAWFWLDNQTSHIRPPPPHQHQYESVLVSLNGSDSVEDAVKRARGRSRALVSLSRI